MILIMYLTVEGNNVTDVAIIDGNLSLWNFVSQNNESSVEIHVQVNNDGGLVWVVVVGIVLSIFILAAIAGNILVIAAIVTDRNLRKAGNNFIISLAVADALVACLVMTFAAVNDLTNKWSFGAIFCNIWQSSDVMCCTASILNICAVSLDRYINIRDPLRYRNLVTHRRALIAVALIWTTSALLSFLPIHFGWHRLGRTANGENQLPIFEDFVSTVVPTTLDLSEAVKEPNGGDEYDDNAVCHLDLNPWYACVSSIISFYIPCIVMIVIYARLYRLSQKHRKSIKSVSVSGDLQRPRSPNHLTSGAVGGGGGGGGGGSGGGGGTGRVEEERDKEKCRNPAAMTNGATVRRLSDSADDRRPKRRQGYFDFQQVPLVMILRRFSLRDRLGSDCSNRSSESSKSDFGTSSSLGNRRLLGEVRTAILARKISNDLERSRSGQPNREQPPPRQTDQKAAITVGCIIGIFLFCWGPFFIINIIGSIWEGSISPVAFTFFTWLGYINSFANPVIYGVTNLEFRRAFFRIITGLFSCRRRDLSFSSSVEVTTGARRNLGSDRNIYREVRTNDSPLALDAIS